MSRDNLFLLSTEKERTSIATCSNEPKFQAIKHFCGIIINRRTVLDLPMKIFAFTLSPSETHTHGTDRQTDRQTHARTHAHTHARTHTHKHARTHTHTRTHTRTHVHTHTHTRTHTHTVSVCLSLFLSLCTPPPPPPPPPGSGIRVGVVIYRSYRI